VLTVAMRLTVMLLFLAAAAPRAQTDPCDAALRSRDNPSNPNGYRQRSDRCEGVFSQEVSATGNLLVASLTATMQGFKPESAMPLVLEWKAPGAVKVNVRAYSLRPRLYYRMDTVQDAVSARFRWPATMLATYALKPTEVGLVAWTAMTVGNQRLEPVYLPLAVRDSASGAWPSAQQLIVVPPSDLKELYVTVSPVDARGVTGRPLRDGPLEYGYYPAGGAIKVEIAALPAPGIYLVQLAAERKDGANIVSRFWMSQP
jgi:hypothetical protein